MMKNLFLIVLISLLLITGLAGAGCSSDNDPTQTPESISSPSVAPSPTTETAELSELEGFFENSVLGFSIHYPGEWEASKGTTEGAVWTVRNSSNSCVVQVFVETEWTNVTLKKLSDSAIDDIRRNVFGYELISEGPIELGNTRAYEHCFTGIESGVALKSKLISVVNEEYAYVILAACEEDMYDLLATTVDSTVYSFRTCEPFSIVTSRENTLVLYNIGPATLDPALLRDVNSAGYVLEIFSGLVTLNQELEVVPDIAESWQVSGDGKTYTFHLRENAKFHDGKKITAEDFKYSLERACDPDTNSQTASSYLGDIVGVNEKLSGANDEISGVSIIDDYTLEITIDAPKSHFLAKLAYPTAFVVDEANVSQGKDWWYNPNGSGPFKLAAFEEDEMIVLERNDLYYEIIPQVQYVTFLLWGGNPMAMYENGGIDINPYVSSADIDRILDPFSPLNDELITIPEFSLWYIGFNTTQPPFDDPKVRQAFCHAVDKDTIIELIFNDMVKRADGILPQGMPGYNDQLAGLDFDPDTAIELIEQSSYGSVDNLPPITFTTSGLGGISSDLEAILGMWQQYLGVSIDIRQMEPEIYVYTLYEEKDDLFDLGWVADYPDPQNFLDILFYSTAEDNVGEYSNLEVDSLLEAAREETDTNTRLSMYQQIEQLVINDAAILPLYFSVSYVLVKPYVKGYAATSLPIPWLKYISLEPHDD